MTLKPKGATRRDDIAGANSLLNSDARTFDILSGNLRLSGRDMALWLHNYGSSLARFRLCYYAFRMGDKNLFWRMVYITKRLSRGALPDDIFPDAAG